MNTRSRLLIIPMLHLLVFAAAEARQATSASSKGDLAGVRNGFDLFRIDRGVIEQFKNAWEFSRCGTASVEAVVLIFRNADGSYGARSLPPNNEFDKLTFEWDREAIGIAHTHPNNCNPRPSANDMQLANKYRVPMFTLTLDGMYMYDPNTKKITRVQDNLNWLKPSTWNRRTQSASVKSVTHPDRQ